jgi:hypothetical protein
VIDEKVKVRDILKKSVTVTNSSNRKLNLYPSVNDINPQEGEEEFVASQNAAERSGSLANWIELSRGVVELGPGESKELPFVIRTHLDAAPGTYHATISLGEGSSRSQAEEAPPLAEVAVNVEVMADIKEVMQLNKFFTDNVFFSGDDVLFNYQLENIGNQELQPRGEIRIYNRRGEEVAAVDVNTEGKKFSPEQTAQLASMQRRMDNAKVQAVSHAYAKLSADTPMSNKERALMQAIGIVKAAGRQGKSVIFTHFVHTNRRVADLVAKQDDVKVFLLTASMSSLKRGAVISEFNGHDGAAVLILNIKIGARGLNLHAARYAFMLSSDYNPATHEQAVARIRRFISEFQTVFVITFMMPSIHTWILSRIQAIKVHQSEELEARNPGRVARMRSTFGHDHKVDPTKAARAFSVDVLNFSKMREVKGMADNFDMTQMLLEALQAAVDEKAPARDNARDNAHESDDEPDDDEPAAAAAAAAEPAVMTELLKMATAAATAPPQLVLDDTAVNQILDEVDDDDAEQAEQEADQVERREPEREEDSPSKRQRVNAQLAQERADAEEAIRTLQYKWRAQREAAGLDLDEVTWVVQPVFDIK